MKLNRARAATVVLGIALLTILPLATPPSAWGQGGPFAGMGRGPKFGAQMSKLFGENQSFAANVEIQATPSDRPDTILMPGKIAFHDGKSRLDMDITLIKGSMMPPGMGEQIKAMGMHEMSMIGRPDKKEHYLAYPNLQAYAVMPEAQESTEPDKLKMDVTELAKETVAGHPCIKNKVTITEPNGKKTESTVWNATDLKKFPVRIQTVEEGTTVQMTFSQVKFDKPDAKLFDAPAGATKYDDVQSLMRGAMMKKLGGGANGLEQQK